MTTGYIFGTTDVALFIDVFFAPRFDQHVRAYRQHRFAREIAAHCATADARFGEMAAGLRAPRSRKLFAEG
jgi:hypothetical protein